MNKRATTLTEKEIARRVRLTETNKNNAGKNYYERYNIVDDNTDTYFITKTCKYCGKENRKWNMHNRSEFCDNKCKLKYMKKNQPLEYKAFTLFACIPLGKNKKQLREDMVRKYINTACKYCHTLLTLKNISLDHIIPIHWKKEGKSNPLFSDINNLHLICKECNQVKRELTEEQYIRLLVFLNNNLDIKQHIITRLKASGFSFRKWTKK